MGDTAIFAPVYILVVAGVVILLGAVWARKTGRLRSRGSKIAALSAILVIAILLWLGPTFFLA